MTLPHGYDAWRLSCPDDESVSVGEDEGETCNRFPEPDEDMPRGYRPRRCEGSMVAMHGEIVCDTCGELA